MSVTGWDCCGWATKNDLLCSDGRIIKRGAFAEQDGATVPLVYQHRHDSIENVLGHALLENRDDGVFAYAYFNDTPQGRAGKEAVEHGDITSFSIYANKLKQVGPNVVHGAIRELSLVLTGANPGACITNVSMSHGEDGEFEGVIYTGEELLDMSKYDMRHAADNTADEDEDDGGETVQDVFNTLTPKQKKVVYYLIDQAVRGKRNNGELGHSDSDDDGDGVEDVLDTLTDRQKEAVLQVIEESVAAALDDYDNSNGEYDDDEYGDDDDEYGDDDDEEYDDDEYDDSVEHSYMEGDMRYNNVFDNSMDNTYDDVLTHAEEATIFEDMKRTGSLKESVLAHADEYGIEQIDYLFPDFQTLNNTPEFIRRDNTWVGVVMNGVHRTPFARIKTVNADITEDAARAKGYMKGNLKKDEVFTLLKRTTSPTTVYKKQRFDRDDLTDITNMDTVAWVKTEMREMLDEEIARAILFSDLRNTSDDDKISEANVRPIYNDAALYTINATVPKGADDVATAKNAIKTLVRAKTKYRGSGTLIFFAKDTLVTEMLLLEDTIGHPLYKSEAELASKLRVSRIVTVPEEIIPNGIYGVAVDLKDYNVGADKGGAVNMFDDFDIDYNQQKYLIETRISGALIKPYSAIVLKEEPAAGGSDNNG